MPNLDSSNGGSSDMRDVCALHRPPCVPPYLCCCESEKLLGSWVSANATADDDDVPGGAERRCIAQIALFRAEIPLFQAGKWDRRLVM